MPWSVRDGPATAEDHETVGHRVRVVGIVRDQDHGYPPLGCVAHALEDARGWTHPERGGRLVEDQDAGTGVEGPRDRESLALPAREGTHQAVGVP